MENGQKVSSMLSKVVVLCFVWIIRLSLGSRDKTELLYLDQRRRNVPGCSRPCSKAIFCYLMTIAILLSVPQPGIDNSQDIPLPWHGIRTDASSVFGGLGSSYPIKGRSSQTLVMLEDNRKKPLSPIPPLKASAQIPTPPEEQRHLCDLPHHKYSGLSPLAEGLKEFLSLLLTRSLRQTCEPFQSEGWGGVLIKVIILSWKGYLQRHLKSLGRCCADKLGLKIVIVHVKLDACVDDWTQATNVTSVLLEKPGAM